MPEYRRLSTIKKVEDFRHYCSTNNINLRLDDGVVTDTHAPLAKSLTLNTGFTIGNRFCVLPMEGWDGTEDGLPTELTIRRWKRFGLSGAKLIWGGEAVAVQPDGRANPNQLMINQQTVDALANLRRVLVNEHNTHYGSTDNLLVGLQLTHSGRFARPYEKTKLEPKILYHHPLLDKKFGIDPSAPVVSDTYIHNLINTFIQSAKLAEQAGFHFVDIKHCHGYLGHEFLTAYDRPGPYGGNFENRTRFLREIVTGIQSEVPEMGIGVRLSAVDFVPFQPGTNSIGEPVSFNGDKYRYGFGSDGTGVGIDLHETFQFLDLLHELGIQLVNITVGSPYYNPHIQRPALFPPSDGYQPPEDPLYGVSRQIEITGKLKAYRPELVFVGSGYSYLQEWLPQVAQHAVRTGQVDFVGLGRMMLSYPDFAWDVLKGKELDRRRICRTFSDCTTAPRKGLVSGCYPLDHFYKNRPEADILKEIKKSLSA